MNKNNKNQRGFGLVEMIIAIGIVGIGIVGTFSMISRFSEQSKIVRDSFVASYLAQEGIEIVKNIRDTNILNSSSRDWDDGIDCSSGCEADFEDASLSPWDDKFLYLENTTGMYKYIDSPSTSPSTSDIKTYYKRMITTVKSGDEIDIMITIYWEDKSIMIRSKIYNWGLWNQA